MLSRFFIQRPIFAGVISILITLVGIVSLLNLPIEQYPNMTPPQIQVTASYPGASAQILADTVAAPLEDQINGVEGMIYMYSESSATGNLTLNVFFDLGTDINTALSNVQDRVDLAVAQLPDVVQKEGVMVKKQTPTILMLVAVQAENDRYDEVYTSNYATVHIADEILRLKGVSNATVINARDFAIRIWLRPDRMAQLGITTTDVIASIHEQSTDYPLGELGQPPTTGPVTLTLPVTATGRFTEAEEFENIILRANQNGSTVRIKDVGRVELGAQDYSVLGELNGKSTALIAIYQEYGANALDVEQEVKATLKKLSARFPPDLVYSIPYDTTTFIRISIKEVERTLYQAAILVALVVFIFLQSLRATFIPVIAMIVSIVGTFTGMHLLGFSLNTLTLFGLVLAIGIVVDDAIVVVENVERNMRENGLAPKEAALKAMQEVSGPIFAIVFVLCSVFIPVAFIGGIAGELYKQFAITISISVIFSGIVALTLSPVLAALLFKKRHKPLPKPAQWFNQGLSKVTQVYLKGSNWLIDRTAIAIGCFIVILGLIVLFFKIIPGNLVPTEDQGYLFTFANLPDGASLDRTEDISKQMTPIALDNPAVESFVAMTGFSLLENLNRTTVGTYFVILKDWSKRTAANLQASAVLDDLGKEFRKLPGANIIPFNPPAIQGLGTVGGVEFWIVNEGSASNEMLAETVEKFISEGSKKPELRGLTASFQPDGMQLFANVDRTKARAFKVPIGEIYQTLQAQLGSIYVNNFNKWGHVFDVMVQSEPEFRTTLEQVTNIFVRSENGTMIPLNSFVTFETSKGPALVSRFNNFPAVKINGGPAEGYSLMQAMSTMENLANDILPEDMSFAWSGLAYEAKTTGSSSMIAIFGALLLVFLILSALYERWSLPVAILLAIPFGILGALIAVWFRGLEDDVYFQIGLVTLIALAAKNAILIVEFAAQKRKEGKTAREAALEAAKLRFRAILMTSFTFIFGVLPLVISTGAGAASRHSVGTGVMGGMLAATLFGVFFVPFFYRLMDRKKEEIHEVD